MTNKWQDSNFRLTLYSSLFLSTFLLVFLPAQFYISNRSEFTSRFSGIILFLLFSAVVIVVLLLIPQLLLRKSSRVYAHCLAAISILFWVTASFLFQDYGALDGRGMLLPALNKSTAYAEAATWIGVLVIVSLWSGERSKFTSSVSVFVFALFALNTALFLVQIVRHRYTLTRVTAVSQEENRGLYAFSTEKNILHIVLDEFQSSVFDALLERDRLRYERELSGFTYFRNTISQFPTTMMSIPNILSGQAYQNDTNKYQFVRRVLKEESVLQRLSESGFDVRLQTTGFVCSVVEDVPCSATDMVPRSYETARLVELSLLRAAPLLGKRLIYNNENWILTGFLSRGSLSGSPAGRGLVLFQNYIQNLQVVPSAAPAYRLYHSMITHSPVAVDRNCKPIHQGKPALNSSMDQAECAMSKVFQVLEYLKRENIYDNSTIIVSSDHGSTISTPEITRALRENAVIPEAYSTALSLLLIKPRNAERKPLVSSSTPATLADIGNTLLGLYNIHPLKDGEDLYHLQPETKRIRQFHFYKWSNDNWTSPRLPRFTKFHISGMAQDPASWTLADEIDPDSLMAWETLEMKDQKSFRYIAQATWSEAEKTAAGVTFCWAVGKSSRIFNKLSPGLYGMELSLLSYPFREPQDLDVYVNTMYAGSLTDIQTDNFRPYTLFFRVKEDLPVTTIELRAHRMADVSTEGRPVTFAMKSVRISPGKMIDVGKPQANVLYKDGWSENERTGDNVTFRWALGKSATIQTIIPGEAIFVKFRILSIPTAVPQNMKVLINDVLAGTIENIPHSFSSYSLKLPQGIDRSRPVEVRFIFSTSRQASPHDPRELAVGFDRIQFKTE